MSEFARFFGPVQVHARATATTLCGLDEQRRRVDVTFVAAPRMSDGMQPPLPATLNDVRVSAEAERIAIEAREGRFDLPVRSTHRHVDVGAAFGARVPPRMAPLGKRVFWRVVLALAASGAGRRILLRLRGR